ncbi:hypothetical protein A6V37_25995 [Paraburkholderia ginsengiterrae]|uniref:Uncharacterized protein n=1 Tax=Paraburkholderia ginsengiterrae TaxID=1462993 RepID=A0A1A9N6C8_9BURK|nr:hypothetical protein A6V37_25995 [Paraburkholderia ginsengiterrae]
MYLQRILLHCEWLKAKLQAFTAEVVRARVQAVRAQEVRVRAVQAQVVRARVVRAQAVTARAVQAQGVTAEAGTAGTGHDNRPGSFQPLFRARDEAYGGYPTGNHYLLGT